MYTKTIITMLLAVFLLAKDSALAACKKDSDCPSGSVCTVMVINPAAGGVCFKQCKTAKDCRSSEYCSPNRDVCRTYCAKNSDCPSGSACVGTGARKTCKIQAAAPVLAPPVLPSVANSAAVKALETTPPAQVTVAQEDAAVKNVQEAARAVQTHKGKNKTEDQVIAKLQKKLNKLIAMFEELKNDVKTGADKKQEVETAKDAVQVVEAMKAQEQGNADAAGKAKAAEDIPDVQ